MARRIPIQATRLPFAYSYEPAELCYEAHEKVDASGRPQKSLTILNREGKEVGTCWEVPGGWAGGYKGQPVHASDKKSILRQIVVEWALDRILLR